MARMPNDFRPGGQKTGETGESLKVEQKVEAPKVGRFRAVGRDYYNPFTKQRFAAGCDIEAIVDGWLVAQLDAGLIERAG